MPRSTNQKKKLPILRRILLERSDENHPLTMKEIISALAAHGIKAERKSIYTDLETLRDLGLDIRVVRSKTVGYYVSERDFELPELKLLVDSVRASKFITERKSALLIKKLSSLANVHDRKALNRVVFVSNRVKSGNEGIYSSIDKIHDAIEANTDISFKYFQWNSSKKKEFRRDGSRYCVSPWSLVWDDSNYYLVGFDKHSRETRHYRVDKMIDVRLESTLREGAEEFKKYDITSYSGAVFGMFGGQVERITLSCTNRLANVMLDRFGSEIPILKDSDDRFRISVNIVPGPIFYGWVLSFGGEVKIVSPESSVIELDSLAKKFSKNLG